MLNNGPVRGWIDTVSARGTGGGLSLYDGSSQDHDENREVGGESCNDEGAKGAWRVGEERVSKVEGRVC